MRLTLPGRRLLIGGAAAVVLACAAAIGGLYECAGSYGVNVLLRGGGTTWEFVSPESPHLSASMRLALRDPVPAVHAGPLAWRTVAEGFDVAELPVLLDDGVEVDRLLLARVDAGRFRFEVRNAPAGDTGLEDWMTRLRAVLVINGSYYSRLGTPDTPFLSDGAELGPTVYDAKHGAFVASDGAAAIRDLGKESWQTNLRGRPRRHGVLSAAARAGRLQPC